MVPVLVGTAAAAGVAGGGAGRGLVLWRFLAALVVALAIQVGTNYANDYSDGVRGTDSHERVGPVRLVGSGLVGAGAVKRAAVLSFGVAGVAGAALAAAAGWWLVLVGAVSFAAGWLYTGGPRPYGYAGWGEAFVFVFFGLVATVGSAYVQIERVSALAVGAALPVGLIATALLVVNNLRDIPSDRRAGKLTLAVRIGDQPTRFLFVGLVVATIVAAPVVAILGGRPAAVMGAFAVLAARRPVIAVLGGSRGADLIPVLAQTGQIQLLFGLLFSGGLYLSG